MGDGSESIEHAQDAIQAPLSAIPATDSNGDRSAHLAKL